MENEKKKTSIVDMELSTFEIPPAGDILVLGETMPYRAASGEKNVRYRCTRSI